MFVGDELGEEGLVGGAFSAVGDFCLHEVNQGAERPFGLSFGDRLDS
jgi:hypothetical protein